MVRLKRAHGALYGVFEIGLHMLFEVGSTFSWYLESVSSSL